MKRWAEGNSNPGDSAVLSCENLCLGYEGRELVHNLSFAVHQGELLAILGENGCGKSTLMRTLLGLQAPLSGRITAGQALGRGRIGYLPQQTLVQKDFPATAIEIVMTGFQGRCGLRPFYTREEKRTAMRNLEKMGAAGLAGRCYRELSGGQQQRVLLARALCATETLLMLDEPVSGLDPDVTAQMYQVIRDLRDSGITILMISHDHDATLRIATHILHLGDRVFFGTRAEYLAVLAGTAAGRAV